MAHPGWMVPSSLQGTPRGEEKDNVCLQIQKPWTQGSNRTSGPRFSLHTQLPLELASFSRLVLPK